MRLLLTGGSGFIGNSFLDLFLSKSNGNHSLVNMDCLSYASTFRDFSKYGKYDFFQDNILDEDALQYIFDDFQPTHIIHMAACSHVDNSLKLESVDEFVQTNVQGTLNLLRKAVEYDVERFLYVSTDEVFGSLDTGFATETSLLNPGNPYSATKAAGEHLVNAWHKSFNLNTVITRCTNNYGPYQHSEKFIPNSIINLLQNKPITLYGDGNQIRQWIHAVDHCAGILKVLDKGVSGEVYNIPGGTSMTNRALAEIICEKMNKNPNEYISYIKDRPGHDVRYAIDSTKMNSLGFRPVIVFEEGLKSTIDWYISKFESMEITALT
jgi:dTDP-glucose 4,6-dehydratase